MSLGTRLLSIGSIASAAVSGSLLHPVVTGQAGAATINSAQLGQGLLPAAMVFASIAVALGLLAFRAEVNWLWRPDRDDVRRGATIALAGMLVTTAVLAGPAAQPAQAAYGFQDCDFSDSLTTAVIDSFTNPRAEGECRFNPADVGNPNGVAETDAYAAGLAISDATDSYLTTSDNFNNATYGTMLMEGKIEVIQALENNETLENATQAANESIDDVAKTRITNLVHNWNGHAVHIEYLAETNASVRYYGSDDPGNIRPNGSYIAAENQTIEGYNIELYVLSMMWTGNPSGASPWGGNVTSLPDTEENFFSGAYAYENSRIEVQEPGGSNYTTILEFAPYQEQTDEIVAQRDRAKDNMAQVAADIYASYEAGDLDATNLAESSPLTMATNAGSELNSTGYYGFASAQAAALGISTDTNTSHVVRHDWTRFDADSGTSTTTTVNTTGTLFYTGDDAPNLSTGSTIDPANHSGEFYMAVSSIEDVNESETPNYLPMNGSFEILSATNTKTGESVNTTSMEPRANYTTTNVSTLQDQIDELRELRDYYQQQQTAAAGGAGSSNTILIAAIALAAGAALMWRRDDD
jgi:hypothetical protein